MNHVISSGQASLGIEFGSTRIKAVLIDPSCRILGVGWHDWENSLVEGIWTYPLDDVHDGLRSAYASLAANVHETYGVVITELSSIGVSAMMHGYMPFDADGQLLVPFRTWRNTITLDSAQRLTETLGAKIPQRWSVAHLHRAITSGEQHVDKISFLTTLAGYVHWQLTGEKVLGVGDAAGMFPISAETNSYDLSALSAFGDLVDVPWKLEDILPTVLVAGQKAGVLTEAGAAMLDPAGGLRPGALFCPPEGDAGTGMMATNAVEVRTGNISAGTSIFAMVVLEEPLATVHDEIDVVRTPDGLPVAMVHCNNCSGELDAWVDIFAGLLDRLGVQVSSSELYAAVYEAGLEGAPDGDGMVAFNYLSGEHVTCLAAGRPLYARRPQSTLSLENFMRLQIMAMFAALRTGMKILFDEGVRVERFIGHGGIFKTPKVAQQILAGALGTPIAVGDGAGEGGAWGIAMLANYIHHSDLSLSDYLRTTVFQGRSLDVVEPVETDVAGYSKFAEEQTRALALVRMALDVLP